jgi:hypothetical protein
LDIKEAGLIAGDLDRHWYYRAKLAALTRMISARSVGSVLDVGAGIGFFAEALLRDTTAASATCVDPGYPAENDRQVAGKKLEFRRGIDRSKAELVLMMDVLEHVPDDVGLLRDYVAKVDPGTHFVVTVPAFMWLWSGHDVFLGHHRRYTLPQIERAMAAAGLRVERGCYYYGAVLPLAALSRIAGRLAGDRGQEPRSQMRAFGKLSNALFWAVCRAELLLFKMNRLAGLTALVRAVKP